MKLTELFLEQLERELPATRNAVERVPEGKSEWRPHHKSMPLGYLASLVAGMPGWVAMMIERDFLDLTAGGGGPSAKTAADLVALVDQSAENARRALRGTTDDHLMKMWQLRVGQQVVDERPRYQNIADTFTHLAHHRGQLTVYLRLNDRPVPKIYGPTADEAWT